MFNRPTTIVGSGGFVCEQLLAQPGNITSPFLKAGALEQGDGASGPQTSGFVARVRETPNVFTVHQPTLNVYAKRLIEVTRIIKESNYDLMLCPMRGARMPGMQAELVSQSDPFSPFDGSDMGKGVNDDRIKADLRSLIFERPCAGEQRKIGVLDTAVGGDSCREMARLLRQVNDEVREQWSATFHLIHAEGRIPPRATDAYRSEEHTFEL